MDDRNSLAYWLPPLVRDGVPVPDTTIVETDVDLVALLDGQKPDRFDEFIAGLTDAARGLAADCGGPPVFLRTGHGSGKHSWRDTCFVDDLEQLPAHVVALVEWSHSVDLLGLPTNVWAAREMLDTQTLFRCARFGGFPVTREFRLFVDNGEIVHRQPYWPADAVAGGNPDRPYWRALLRGGSQLDAAERVELDELALCAAAAVDNGFWSVDLLQTRNGKWFVTDMADGARSFRYDPKDERRW